MFHGISGGRRWVRERTPFPRAGEDRLLSLENSCGLSPCRLTPQGLYAAYFLTWLASWDVGAAGRGGYTHMLSGHPDWKDGLGRFRHPDRKSVGSGRGW